MGPVGRFAPPAALMALIFVLSAQPDLNSGLSADLALRKLAHMIEFGVLWALWLRALPGARGPSVAAAISLAYAASDELHQGFVDGRTASPVDWAIDAAGVGVAVATWLILRPGRRDALPTPAPTPAEPPPASKLERAVLLSPDLVARRAASFAPDAESRWMLRQPRALRAVYARDVLGRDDVAQQVWMLRQPEGVRESYIRDVLQHGD